MCRRNARSVATVSKGPDITDDGAIRIEGAGAAKRHVLCYEPGVGPSRVGNWSLISGGITPTWAKVAKLIAGYQDLIRAIRIHRPELRCRIECFSFPVAVKHNLISVRRPRRRIIILQRVCQSYLITAVGIHQIDFLVSVYTRFRQHISVIVSFLPRLHNTIARAHECDLKGISRPSRFLIFKWVAGKCKPGLVRTICVHYIDGRNSRMIALAGESDLRAVWRPRRLCISRNAIA